MNIMSHVDFYPDIICPLCPPCLCFFQPATHKIPFSVSGNYIGCLISHCNFNHKTRLGKQCHFFSWKKEKEKNIYLFPHH